MALALSAAASACVSEDRFMALQADHDALQLAMKETEEARVGCEDALVATRARLEEVDAEARRSKETVEARDRDMDIFQRERAGEVAQLRHALEGVERELDAARRELAAALQDKSRSDASVEQLKRAMEAISLRKAQAEKRIEEFRALVSRFQRLIDAGKLKVKIIDGRMIVELATDVLFASGSAKLSKEGQASVEEVTRLLSDIPERRYQIDGHTDNVPIQSAQYPSNWDLATARALTVVKAMQKAGMPPERVSAAGHGEFHPAATNDTPEGRQLNRRIEIIIVPDLSTLPGFEELKRLTSS